MSDKSSSKDNIDASAFDQNVGEVVSFVGLKGVMKVVPSSNNPELFLDIKKVLLHGKGTSLVNIQATVKSIKIAKNCFQIELDQYDSRTAVEHFRGATVSALKSQLRKLAKNQWWAKDLIGISVYSVKGELIGTVCDAQGEHGEFLEIKKANDAEGKTIVISFVDQLFPVVDIEARRIVMNDLPGLFD